MYVTRGEGSKNPNILRTSYKYGPKESSAVMEAAAANAHAANQAAAGAGEGGLGGGGGGESAAAAGVEQPGGDTELVEVGEMQGNFCVALCELISFTNDATHNFKSKGCCRSGWQFNSIKNFTNIITRGTAYQNAYYKTFGTSSRPRL